MSEKIKKKYKPVDIVLIVIAAVLAFLFVYPVLFAFMSAFKSNGDILRAPAAFPTSIYTQNFVDLFQMSDFGHAIINTVFLTVASELLIICIVPMAAMGNVISSYTAQNLGAGRKDRVVEGYHTGYRIVFAFAVILCVILELFYQPLIELFLGDEGTGLAVSTGVSYLRFIGWFFVLIGLKMITDGLLRGAGDMKMFTVANLVNLTIRVVLAVTLAPRIGIEMVWYAVPIGWLANYLISFAEYRTGKWKRI